MPYRIPYPYLQNLGLLQESDIVPVLRPAFDEGSATVGDVAKYVQPYKKYIANLTQSGLSAPTALEFENTLGVTISYSYDTTGDYSLTASASIFSQYYTWMIIAGSDNTFNVNAITWISDTVLRIRTNDSSGLADGILTDTAIEIRVYEMPPP